MVEVVCDRYGAGSVVRDGAGRVYGAGRVW